MMVAYLFGQKLYLSYSAVAIFRTDLYGQTFILKLVPARRARHKPRTHISKVRYTFSTYIQEPVLSLSVNHKYSAHGFEHN